MTSGGPLELYDRLLSDGIAPEVDAFCASFPRHPELREAIDALLALRDDLDTMVGTGGVTPPSRVGAYEVGEALGEGGMGTVYEAVELATGRAVAVKLMKQRAPSETATARFEREAQICSQLEHPGIAKVVSYGVAEELAYLVAERVPGNSLRTALQSGPLPPDQAVAIATQVADALGHAHTRQVIHRDVTPSNIMLTPERRAVLIDFGIARVSGGARVTRTGVFIGSPAYAAPEQLRGEHKALGPWTDVFALGAVLFEMLTGAPPFDGDATKRGWKPQPLPSMKGIPRKVGKVVSKCLAHDPSERFAAGDGLGEALRRV